MAVLLATLVSPLLAKEAAVGGTGRIQPLGGLIAVNGQYGQQVERVDVEAGQKVRKGAVLFTLADRTQREREQSWAAARLSAFEQQAIQQRRLAELEMESAGLTVLTAKANILQIQNLTEQTVSLKERREREHALAHSETMLKQATVRRDELRHRLDSEITNLASALERARQYFAASALIAPRDATVVEVNVSPGMALGGLPAVLLADTSRMYVVADFFEGDLPKLVPGQRVRVSNNALGAPLHGAIERIGRIVDSTNRLVKVWVKLDMPTPADRYIGMQVDVRVELQSANKVPASR
jgi:multidrug resistance efflux pump